MRPADPRIARLRDHLVGQVLRGTDGIRFHIRQLIGEGGQGWVYQGNYDEADGVRIVIKVLRPDAVTEDTLLRFRREAAVLRQLGAQANPNPNLVRFYDQGAVRLCPPNSGPRDEVELAFTVLEYVHGVTLAQVIHDQRGAGLTAHRTRRLLRQVAFALTSVHAQNIIHRDLKPSNILVTSEHEAEIVKVTDFGLAKLIDPGTQRTQMLAGATLGYAPPEQFEKGNDRVGPRTDVFSLAVILYECLTGSPAFAPRANETAMRVIDRMINGPRPSLAQVSHALDAPLRDNRNLLALLDTELARATHPDPAHRHTSVREFWDAVEPALRTVSETSLPPAPIPLVSKPRGSKAPAEAPTSRYTFRQLAALPPQEPPLRAATLTDDGRVILALNGNGVWRWSGGAWAHVRTPAWLDHGVLNGVTQLVDGSLLLYGDRGTIVALAPNGEAHPWQVPEADLTLRSALFERAGITLVGGRRSSLKGALVEMLYGRTPKVRTIEGAATFQSVARLASGALLACGDDGTLARIDLATPAAIPWGRTGHLFAIAARPDGGAQVVGSGGHALTLSANLQATLEPVQTTRDLLSVKVGPGGAAWASATHGRILARQATTWVRIPVDVDVDESVSILAVHPFVDSILAVTATGQVLEGRPAT